MTKSPFEETLIEVWRQAIVENAKDRQGERRKLPCSSDSQARFATGENPETKSRWAQLARSGKKVMQFLSQGRYVANVVDGKVTHYGNAR